MAGLAKFYRLTLFLIVSVSVKCKNTLVVRTVSPRIQMSFLHLTLLNTRFQVPLEPQAAGIIHIPKKVMAVFERRYLKKEFHRDLHRSQRWGLHPKSSGSLRLVHLNPTSVTTSREANRYRLERMGMTG